MMRNLGFLMISMLLFALLGCSSGWQPNVESARATSRHGDPEVTEAIARFKSKDPGLQAFFDKAYGYAVFPSVGKAGIGIGGAYGGGKVYRHGGRLVGTTSLTQATIGFQLGAQAYSELIFFKDKATFENFTQGNFEFDAQASAVAVTAGASANAAYSHGTAIFTMAKGGLMYEATVGGQKFSFTPVGN